MYEYAISFEIKADSTYGERYSSLMALLTAIPNSYLWSETTSFVLIQSPEKIDGLADRLVAQSKFSPARDKLLIVDHISNVAAARGVIQYQHALKIHFKSCVIK